MRKTTLKSSAIFMLLLGLVSLFMTTSIIFDLFHIRQMEGNYLSFIVDVNLICSIIYLISAYEFFKEKIQPRRIYLSQVLFSSSRLLLFGFTLKKEEFMK